MNVRPFTLLPLALAIAVPAGVAAHSSIAKPITRSLKQQSPAGLKKQSKTAVSSLGFTLDTKQFMPVSEIRPGMKGYALTVFKGTKIEKFHIEVLGIISKFNGGKDYILFRALDGPSVTEGLNIAHGMSGSPIYIGGRLAGAISMGIPGTDFPRESIALATPIEAMFDSWNPKLPSTTGPISALPAPLDSVNSNGQHFEEFSIPVSVSGLSPEGVARMATALSPYHMDLIAGGGDAGSESSFAKTATLQPGSAVGVSLVQGDVNLTATGTVTYRQGNRLLLFGHPFTGFGPVDAALTTAYVVNIYPSYQSSVKLGSPLKTVGRITQDRPYAVGAEIGSLPHMIPVTLSINDVSAQVQKTYHVNVINHPLLTPQLVTQVANQLIEQVHGQPGDCIADVTVDADVNGYGHIVRHNRYFDDLDIGQSSVGDLDNIVHTVTGNQFSPLTLKSVHVDVVLRHSHDTATIERIFLSKSKYVPGDVVHVGVVLRPFEQPAVYKTVDIKIPRDTPNGLLTLSVHGGAPSSSGATSLLGAIFMLRPADSNGGSTATNVAQLVKKLLEEPTNNQLVTRLELPTSAVIVSGTKLSHLPPTMVGAMVSSRTTGQRQERDDVKVTQDLSYVVSGDQALTITVQKKSLAGPAAVVDKSVSLSSSSLSLSSIPSMDSPDGGPGLSEEYAQTNSPSDTSDYSSGSSSLLTPPAGIIPAVGVVSRPNIPASAVAPDGAFGPEASPPPGDKPSNPKSVVRTALMWRQSGITDFTTGTLQDSSVTNKGDICPSSTIAQYAATPANYLWSLTDDNNGGLYAGAGDNGTVYHVTSNQVTPLYRSTDLEMNSLTTDDSGAVYASGIPSGNLYKIDSTGKGIVWFKPEEPYVTALASTSSKIYVGTGGGTASVYSVPVVGIAPTRPILTTHETQILSLDADTSGNVYAGTSPNGLVYRIAPDGRTSVLWDSPETNVTGICTDANGTVYASTSPRGNIYRLNPDGTATALLDKSVSDLAGLTINSAGTITACAGNVIYSIWADGSITTTTGPDGQRFISLASTKSGTTYVGTATVGSIYGLVSGSDRRRATYTSPVFDAGTPSQWGTIAWNSDSPTGFGWYVQTRTGDTPDVDDSWSGWSGPYTKSGLSITAPVSRFIQYQAFYSDSSDVLDPAGSHLPIIGSQLSYGHSLTGEPLLHDITLSYLPRNQGPQVKLSKPSNGAVLSSSQLLQWTVQNPDKDTLSYDLFYSSDNGKTWKPLTKKAVPSEGGASGPPSPGKPLLSGDVKHKPSTAALPSDPATAMAQMKKDLDNHPEIPAAVRDQMLAQAPSIINIEVDPDGTAPADNATDTPIDLTDTSFSWDTTQAHDGPTLIKVIASDRPSNAINYKTDTDISAPILIVNTKPTLSLDAAVVAANGTVTISGRAEAALDSPQNPILAVQFKVDDASPLAAAPKNGLFDEPAEQFAVATSPLKKGPHTIEVQAEDRAGNWTTQTVKVIVP